MGVSLACLGDVMLARGVSEALEKGDPAAIWGNTLPILHAADLRLANLECCVSDRGTPFQPPRVFSFRAIPKAIDALVAARIDVVTLANNHSLDWGEDALDDTLMRLDSAGIAHVGAGSDSETSRAPALLRTRPGPTIAFIGLTDNYPEYAAGEERPGTFYLEIREENVSVVEERLRQARSSGAEIVVVTAHWGPNMRRRPPDEFREFARAVIDAGADLWFGHSAHLFQGVEYRNGRPIIYDGGDFVDDYAVDPEERNDRSVLWLVRFDRPRVVVEAYPVELSLARTALARGQAFGWIARRLTDLCREMGSEVVAAGRSLVVQPT